MRKLRKIRPFNNKIQALIIEAKERKFMRSIGGPVIKRLGDGWCVYFSRMFYSKFLDLKSDYKWGPGYDHYVKGTKEQCEKRLKKYIKEKRNG
jgi:hypothetical protein